ncbi:MAG: M56 family metallopeptidase [Oscillospiraceae bacterium]|nr:M56 family metallopeptidase [Oscillospiraceae bacterium]
MAQLIQRAIVGTALILVVMLLRRGLKNRLPVETWLVLWGVCLFRLLSPVIPTSSASLSSLLLMRSQSTSAALTMSQLLAQSPSVILSGEQVSTSLELTYVAGTGISVRQVVLVVYWAGAVCVLLWLLAGWFASYRSIRGTRRLPREDARYQGLPKGAVLREGVLPEGFLTFGVIRPQIVIPPNLSEQELQFVLPHEGVHARRRDNVWHYVMAVALVLFWWNPAVWRMSRLLRLDVEKSCDRAVLDKLGENRKKDYAYTLISLSMKGKTATFSYTFSGKSAEERIISIMKRSKVTALAGVCAMVLVLGVSNAFAAGTTEGSPSLGETTFDTVVDYIDYLTDAMQGPASLTGSSAELEMAAETEATYSEPKEALESVVALDADELSALMSGILVISERPINSAGVTWYQDSSYAAYRILVQNTTDETMTVSVVTGSGTLPYTVAANSTAILTMNNAETGQYDLDFQTPSGSVGGCVSVCVSADVFQEVSQ